MNILVTGAAGYIGSIVAQELIQEGNTVVALDNLEQGHLEAVIPEALFVHADLRIGTGMGTGTEEPGSYYLECLEKAKGAPTWIWKQKKQSYSRPKIRRRP
jgi:nucleoside-diphosphate-sugar epimerase